MPKTSDWVIVATEGNTIDDRKITKSWINDMADLYSKEEYTAMVWPEHSRSVWGPYNGNNWGIVEELKADNKDGKRRLFARITPNQHLLDANKESQKLFTSIEPKPDFKGEGKCYLIGLGVTDSPASTGTTLLKFSRKDDDEIVLKSDALEEVDFSQCFSMHDRFFSVCKQFFLSGDVAYNQKPDTTTEPEDTDVTEDQLKAALSEQFSAFKQEMTTEFEQKFSQQEPAQVNEPEAEPSGITVELFSSELEKQLKPVLDKVNGLETKFAELSQEAPGQRPDETGASTEMEVW